MTKEEKIARAEAIVEAADNIVRDAMEHLIKAHILLYRAEKGI